MIKKLQRKEKLVVIIGLDKDKNFESFEVDLEEEYYLIEIAIKYIVQNCQLHYYKGKWYFDLHKLPEWIWEGEIH